MVTKDMKEQIQYACQAKEMHEYLRELNGWTDRQLAGINLQGIGIAKKRLQLHRSIVTTKMLHNWLNVGKQKGYMSKDHRCPGCSEDTKISSTCITANTLICNRPLQRQSQLRNRNLFGMVCHQKYTMGMWMQCVEQHTNHTLIFSMMVPQQKKWKKS
jgi:hypothetical protein